MLMQSGRSPARLILPVKIYSPERQATLWEQALLVVMFYAFLLPLEEYGPLRNGCMAVLLGVFAYHARETVPMMLKSWPLLLVPVMGLLSIFWTEYPSAATRIGILHLVTPFLLVTIAARLRGAEILRVIMLAGAAVVLYCVPYYATLAEGGPYEQKNILAYHMMIITLVALAVALHEKEHALLRVIAAAIAGTAFTFQLIADSATSLLFALVGSAALIAVKLVWSKAEKVANARLILFGAVIAGLLGVVLALSMMPQNRIVADFLDLFGKDATLTGRTDIWKAAEMAASENPWFGVGLEGFWQPNTGLAATLAELTYKDPGTFISFHSAFWEMRVHLGFVGLGLFIFAMTWAGLRTLNMWLQNGSVINSALLLFFFINLASCFTESYATATFSPAVSLMYFGALVAFGSGERKFLGVGRAVEQED